jgi:hypothetical protein
MSDDKACATREAEILCHRLGGLHFAYEYDSPAWRALLAANDTARALHKTLVLAAMLEGERKPSEPDPTP